MPSDETLNKIKAFEQKVYNLTTAAEKAVANARETLQNGDPMYREILREQTGLYDGFVGERVLPAHTANMESAMEELLDISQQLENALSQLED